MELALERLITFGLMPDIDDALSQNSPINSPDLHAAAFFGSKAAKKSLAVTKGSWKENTCSERSSGEVFLFNLDNYVAFWERNNREEEVVQDCPRWAHIGTTKRFNTLEGDAMLLRSPGIKGGLTLTLTLIITLPLVLVVNPKP